MCRSRALTVASGCSPAESSAGSSGLLGVRILRTRKISSVPWKVARKDTQDVLATIDYQRVVDLRAAMLRSHGGSDSEANSVNGAWKFLDIDLWVPVNLERVYRLELQSSPTLDILDISGGAGYFAYICQHFGHRVHTTDIDEWDEFNEMMEILSLERSVLWVEPMTPIPFYGRKFDLITSFMIAFNLPQVEEKRWGIEEWEFLLSDLEENHLKENGVIYLLMNPHPDRSHYSPELHDYLIRRGAEVEGARGRVPKSRAGLIVGPPGVGASRRRRSACRVEATNRWPF